MTETTFTRTVSNDNPEIVIAKDHILVCGQFVRRPDRIAPSQWLRYWERVTNR